MGLRKAIKNLTLAFRALEAAEAKRRSDAEAALDEARHSTGIVRWGSRLCIGEEMQTAEYRALCADIHEEPRFHRKQWEFFFISRELQRAGVLRSGACGLGFGVGTEPLTSLFASHGVRVLATDLAPDDKRAKAWRNSKQHAAGRSAELNARGICPPDAFKSLVSYRNVDMNEIPTDLVDFDFIWSSCSLEHVGSLEKARDFCAHSMRCLRPGGIAVHTTEFNLSSNNDTIDAGPTVLLRRRDIEEICGHWRSEGHFADSPNYSRGSLGVNQFIDIPPYSHEPHLRLAIGRYATTSIGLVVRRGTHNI